MKLNFRTIGKAGFLLVFFGFFMPVACNQNGFEIAKHLTNANETFSGLLMYLLFISAAAGLAIGVFLLMRKKINPNLDWLVICACIISGLIVYFRHLDGIELQQGAYMILIGWITALAAQIASKVKGET